MAVRLEGEKLKIAARYNPSERLLEKLKTHKADIVAHLQGGIQVDLEERAAMAADSVPERYLDAWAWNLAND